MNASTRTSTALDPFDLPVGEARALFERGVPVYLPVNPVEYHGPHLSLHNDHLVSVGLATDLQRALDPHGAPEPFLLAASIEAGVEPCPGPGSRASSFAEVRSLAVEAAEALASLGARRVVLMTFHGAPLHALALQAAVRVLEARGVRALQPLNIVMREMLSLDVRTLAPAFAHIPDAGDRERLMRDLATDFHAGFFETSLALHYAPASVAPSYRELPPCAPVKPDFALAAAARVARLGGRIELAQELTFGAIGRGWAALKPFLGYTGEPAFASPEAGAVFARHIVARYAETTRAVFAGAPAPEPIMSWLGWATLHGAIPGMPAPRAG